MKALGGFFSRYAKAMVPAITTAAAVVERWAATGHFDRVAAGSVAGGAITALAVALVANAPTSGRDPKTGQFTKR